jgi:hypothetical protein
MSFKVSIFKVNSPLSVVIIESNALTPVVFNISNAIIIFDALASLPFISIPFELFEQLTKVVTSVIKMIWILFMFYFSKSRAKL